MSRADRTDGLRAAVERIEAELAGRPFVEVARHERNGRAIVVCLTDRLRRQATRERAWLGRPFLATLDNARHGFDRSRSRSRGGRDGVYRLDRRFVPANSMMVRLFDRYLDRPDSGALEVARGLGVSLDDLVPVRLVGHHLRIVGVLAERSGEDWLVLVDVDGR